MASPFLWSQDAGLLGGRCNDPTDPETLGEGKTVGAITFSTTCQRGTDLKGKLYLSGYSCFQGETLQCFLALRWRTVVSCFLHIGAEPTRFFW